MGLGRFVPRPVVDEIRLRRTQRAHPQADYIRSPLVSPQATIGANSAMGELVVVNAGVTIGHHTYANRGALIMSGSIGNYCSIAHYSQIGAEQHPVRHVSTSPWVYGSRSVASAPSGFDELPAPPVIGSDVWIGSAAIIQQGVSIGHGAIVASGAVVTKDVEPFSIVAGVAAKRIGQRFSDEDVARILADPWWDWPAERLRGLAEAVRAGEDWPRHYS